MLAKKHKLAVCLVIACLLHFFAGRLPVPQSLPYEAREAERLAKLKEKPIEVERYPDDKTPRTIVQTSKAKEQDENNKDKAKFGGEFRNRVKKETQAARKGKFSESPAPKGGSPTELQAEGEKVAKPRGLAMSDLMGTGTSPNHFADDIARGSETVLNTDPVMYASFINRIAEEIYDPWVHFTREAIDLVFLKGKKLEANTYVTKLQVVMNKSGEVTAIQTLQSSGITELDEATKKAFWESEPFPNPPNQMFQKDQLIRLTYEFHFEMKGSGFNIVPWSI